MRAKFVLHSIERTQAAEKLSFSAVTKATPYGTDGEDENNTYAKFTPQATLSMLVTNPALFGTFAPGQQFYVDFTLAEE